MFNRYWFATMSLFCNCGPLKGAALLAKLEAPEKHSWRWFDRHITSIHKNSSRSFFLVQMTCSVIAFLQRITSVPENRLQLQPESSCPLDTSQATIAPVRTSCRASSVVYRVHSWVRLLMTVYSLSTFQHKLASRMEASSIVPALFLYVLQISLCRSMWYFQ